MLLLQLGALDSHERHKVDALPVDITAAVAFEENLGNLNLVYRSDGPVTLVQREELKVYHCSVPFVYRQRLSSSSSFLTCTPGCNLLWLHAVSVVSTMPCS